MSEPNDSVEPGGAPTSVGNVPLVAPERSVNDWPAVTGPPMVTATVVPDWKAVLPPTAIWSNEASPLMSTRNCAPLFTLRLPDTEAVPMAPAPPGSSAPARLTVGAFSAIVLPDNTPDAATVMPPLAVRLSVPAGACSVPSTPMERKSATVTLPPVLFIAVALRAFTPVPRTSTAAAA
jgi:hypothetical protein